MTQAGFSDKRVLVTGGSSGLGLTLAERPRDTLRGLAGGRFLIVPGSRTRAAAAVLRHLPGLSRAIGDARVRKVYEGPPQ